MFLGWRDKRNLLMLSNFHAPGTQMIRCKERSGKICEYRRSDVMCDYTSKMSPVEQTDYYCSSYALMCERCKWWQKTYYFESWKYVSSVASSCWPCAIAKQPEANDTNTTGRCFPKNFWGVCNSSAQMRACLSMSDVKERVARWSLHQNYKQCHWRLCCYIVIVMWREGGKK